jgi:hypothetical protein
MAVAKGEEQIPYNAFAADMFAFGLVAHHVITGRTFEKGKSNTVAFTHDDMKRGMFPPLISPGCDTEDGTKQVYAKGAELRALLLQFEPKRRLSAADTVDFLLGRTIEAHPIEDFCRTHGLGILWETYSTRLRGTSLHELMGLDARICFHCWVMIMPLSTSSLRCLGTNNVFGSVVKSSGVKRLTRTSTNRANDRCGFSLGNNFVNNNIERASFVGPTGANLHCATHTTLQERRKVSWPDTHRQRCKNNNKKKPPHPQYSVH